MNIQDALKETEIVTPDYVNSKKESHAKLFDGILYWYDVKRDEYLLPVTLQGINNINWQPYHEVKEIRPEKAGELWFYDISCRYHHTEWRNKVNLYLIGDGLSLNMEEHMNSNIIHNKNGWKLLYSPDKEVMDRIKEVEDPNVKRIRIKDVTWHKGRGNGVSVVFPIADNSSEGSAEVGKDLLTYGPMTMILEMSKDKP